jgi:GNAT superfamily N-acetyltransferase
MAMFIRTARESDVERIALLTAQLGYDVTSPDVKVRLSRLLSHPDHAVFVADRDGLAVGWIHALVAEYIESGPFAFIGGLVVDRDHRRQGIAGALMARAEDWARKQGCSVVRLTSSLTRTAAHQFYKDIGYTIVKTQYSLGKTLDSSGDDLQRFVPRVDGT